MRGNEAEPTSDNEFEIIKNKKRETRMLQLFFLGPLLLAILIIITALFVTTYLRQKQGLAHGVIQLRTTATKLYDKSIQQDMRALHTVMDVLEHDEILHAALARKDRKAILERAIPMFDKMKSNFNITHFYFTGPDRVNLLRAHQPKRFGDVIDRVTTLNAERSGAMEYGVELGPLGLLTLRLVSPWYDTKTHQLIGYVELGMEIDKLLDNVQNLFGLDAFVLIKKEYVQRKQWEEGMRVMGRQPDWDQFPDAVFSVQGQHDFPEPLIKRYVKTTSTNKAVFEEMTCNGHPCQAMSLPLTDVSGRNVAEIILLVDTSRQVAEMRQTIMVGTVASVINGAILFVLFYWLVGRIGRRIERDEDMLRELASHDSLTGLYNHHMFYSLLQDEIARTQRHQRPVSVLMIDIDHFKRVNDTYGHVAGDRVLEKMASVLQKSMRQEDRVCRYGGEEVSVILPETDTPTAVEAAERLRVMVQNTIFEDDNGRHILITISIGVATLQGKITTLQDLVSASDTALYAAKESGRNRVCRFEDDTVANA
jgi:diguanylate cyclase (GGDEF)-like protein